MFPVFSGALHSFLWIQTSFESIFFYSEEIPLVLLVCLLVMSSLGVCVSENIFILPFMLKEYFLQGFDF